MKNNWNYFNNGIVFFVFLFFFSLNLFSETIILRNGNVKKGRIVSQDKLSMVFEEKDAKEPESFLQKEILKISYKDLTQAEINQLLKNLVVEMFWMFLLVHCFRSRRWTSNITLGKAVLRSLVLPGWGNVSNRQIAGTAYFYFS
ncbi:MAG: hypothetical protein IPG24_12615 [Leptospiraceae bacterium]|nr:hypothetical protein [Leptospiraceae bacterium]